MDVAAIGDTIRLERKKQKLTQEELAAVSGVGIRFLHELESGKESCHLGKALRVLQALGLELSLVRRGESI